VVWAFRRNYYALAIVVCLVCVLDASNSTMLTDAQLPNTRNTRALHFLVMCSFASEPERTLMFEENDAD
jgi:hypothetical protein